MRLYEFNRSALLVISLVQGGNSYRTFGDFLYRPIGESWLDLGVLTIEPDVIEQRNRVVGFSAIFWLKIS